MFKQFILAVLVAKIIWTNWEGIERGKTLNKLQKWSCIAFWSWGVLKHGWPSYDGGTWHLLCSFNATMSAENILCSTSGFCMKLCAINVSVLGLRIWQYDSIEKSPLIWKIPLVILCTLIFWLNFIFKPPQGRALIRIIYECLIQYCKSDKLNQQ